MVHEGLAGVNETHAVQVTLKDGATLAGFPDARKSKRGCLVLVAAAPGSTGRHEESRPVAIDEIAAVRRTPL